MAVSFTGWMFDRFLIAALNATSANSPGVSGPANSSWSLFEGSASNVTGLNQLKGGSLLSDKHTLSSFSTGRF